ncbi:MAG: hypothetical protein QXH21_07940, partial [Ignisphaera sp.]
MNNIHPLVWVEVIEHALQLYECGEIEVEHLATVVRYVAKILGLLNVSDDVKRNPRRAVRHAVRIVDNYLKLGKTQIAPVIVSITLNDLVEMV